MPKASDHMKNPSVQQNSLINTTLLSQNNTSIMGKTVLNTVYQIPSQMPNQTINSTVQLQNQSSNSINKNKNLNNNTNSQVGSNIPIQNNIGKTAVLTANTPDRISAVETSKTVQIAKTQIPKGSKSKNITINKEGRQISNIDLNDDTQDGNDNLDLLANTAQSVYPSQKNKLPTVSQKIKEQTNTQQSINDQKIYTTIQLVQNQSVQNPNNQSLLPNHQSQKGSTISHQTIQQQNLAHTTMPLPNNNKKIMGQQQNLAHTALPLSNNNKTMEQQQQNLAHTTLPLPNNNNKERGQQQNLAHTAMPLSNNNNKTIGNASLNALHSTRNPNVNHINTHSKLNNININPNNASRAPVPNSNIGINNQNQNASTQNQSKNPSSSIHQSNQPVQQGSQIKRSHKEELKQSSNKKVGEMNGTSIMRKSSLKASRNKSPPQVIKTSEGKIKIAEIDNNGNSYTIETDKETPDICSNLNKYLENEIKHSQLKETKPENPRKGNGFRYYGQLTKAGRNQNGQKKINQDTPLVHLNIGGIAGFNLFGVLDGHGPHGHFVSQFCKEHFIKYMTNYAESCMQKKIKTPEEIYNELKNNKYAYIIDIFNKADVEMSKQNQFDYNFSGTTCNIVFQFNKYLVSCSVGDSRGILIEDRGDSKNLGIVELSHDHKPDLPGEIERIQLNGGVVDKITDPFGEKVGPPRVWKAEANYPGLAMSRSLGDFQAKQCGVIATPEIIEYKLTRNSKYLIVCSDGVWEFIENEQVRDLGNVFFNKNDVGGFCSDLVKFAVHSWEQFDIIRDDITVVCVYF